MIVVEDLQYSYETRSFKNFILQKKKERNFYIDNLNIASGSRVAIIGTNGAGKSTLTKLLIGILKPDSGTIFVDNLQPFLHRKQLVANYGIVWGNRSTLWWDLSVEENFDAMKQIYQISDTQYKDNLEKYLVDFTCSDLLKQQVRKLSLGQRMKIEIISSLLHNPKYLFYDEPFLGLDYITKKSILSSLDQYLQKNHATLLLISHDFNDLSTLCNELVLLDRGKVVVKDKIEHLVNSNMLNNEYRFSHIDTVQLNCLQKLSNHITNINDDGEQIIIQTDSSISLEEIFQALIHENNNITGMEISKNDLSILISLLLKKYRQEHY